MKRQRVTLLITVPDDASDPDILVPDVLDGIFPEGYTVELVDSSEVEQPVRCGHSGGQGIGAGHVCRCVCLAGHSLASSRPHGCTCGALWADS